MIRACLCGGTGLIPLPSQWVKDPALLPPGHSWHAARLRFHTWPRNFHMPRRRLKRERRNCETPGLKGAGIFHPGSPTDEPSYPGPSPGRPPPMRTRTVRPAEPPVSAPGPVFHNLQLSHGEVHGDARNCRRELCRARRLPTSALPWTRSPGRCHSSQPRASLGLLS